MSEKSASLGLIAVLIITMSVVFMTEKITRGIQSICAQGVEERFQIERPKDHYLVLFDISDPQRVFNSVFEKIGEIFRYVKSFLGLNRENEIKLVFSAAFYLSILVFGVHLLRSFKKNKSNPVFPVKIIGSEVPLWFWTIFSRI